MQIRIEFFKVSPMTNALEACGGGAEEEVGGASAMDFFERIFARARSDAAHTVLMEKWTCCRGLWGALTYFVGSPCARCCSLSLEPAITTRRILSSLHCAVRIKKKKKITHLLLSSFISSIYTLAASFSLLLHLRVFIYVWNSCVCVCAPYTLSYYHMRDVLYSIPNAVEI